MKIVVKTEEKNIILPIPNFVLLNKFIYTYIMNKLVLMDKEEINGIYFWWRKLIKKHRGLVLFEVESASGEYVKITL